MEDLLFLVHRIPYPPNKGDKIRSFNLLQYLSCYYRIHLGTFIDQPTDQQYRETVQSYCVSTWFGNLSPRHAKLKSIIGLLCGEPLTLPYYYQYELEKWIKTQCAKHHITRVLVYSSAMAQYVLDAEFSTMQRIIDFVDVDSEKWNQYSTTKRFPMRWVYRREAAQLGQFERKVAEHFNASIFVSDAEAALFRQQLGFSTAQIVAINNGVDAEFFAPDSNRLSPYHSISPRLVFTGAMDYWANEEGASWFAQHILPAIRQTFPSCEFYIVGMNPTAGVRQLADLPGVAVTGAVADIRPYVQYADAVVVPLRIARGIQNKVLEAMAMARPVVTTRTALEGISAEVGREVRVADTASAFAEQVLDILNGKDAMMGIYARHFVEKRFSWAASLPKVLTLLEGSK
ncbi:TIGR03087 family PEP-CTERM/XrtA system glycosyltransferase [Chromatium okenii]|jgi:sugar transferase (PEP-CTERM/EpsH1 system associated)|uniref:TIGR03087 family PEP-CTERM/XrtA system glycosyltransferase n=1 Tax=Chromatium okenii TaxID=61644 RepID=UPI0026EE8E58|nr:TIGR03087 family PEP-CTERM/XrtA system glycosyltransferase [Chromatium okenii]MBV5310858.1 TIGR03087 family PEP-CTERM/XrtA system glycosyltransferase [Chromatium okenii]